MINFFKNKEKIISKDNDSLRKIAALLIHAAKIDENYEETEKDIIKKTLIELGAEKSNIDDIISKATTIEENSNKIHDFTREIKNSPETDKIKIIESLWKIIYSNNNADMDETNLQKARLKLEDAGSSVLTVELDVSQEDQWQEVANQAIARFKKIHMVVNNAGVGGDTGSIESQDTKGWQWTLDVNLMGVVYGAKVMTPFIKMHGEGGWMINVASMAGLGGIPYAGAYTASKAAVIALSESWVGELEKDSIHVSVLCPAFVQTRIYESERNR